MNCFAVFITTANMIILGFCASLWWVQAISQRSRSSALIACHSRFWGL